MEFQNLLSEKNNKYIINLSSAEIAQRVVTVRHTAFSDDLLSHSGIKK